MKGTFMRLFWWLFAVFAIGQISEIFHIWIVGVLAALAFLGVVLAIIWPKKDNDAGALATTMLIGISVFMFLVLADSATFFHLGWLQGVCLLIITVAGVGCGLYDFDKYVKSLPDDCDKD